MTSAIDDRLAALLPDLPWREPVVLPPAGTGDASVDQLFEDLTRADPSAVEGVKQALVARPREVVGRVATRWLDAIGRDPEGSPYYRGVAEIETEPALKARAVEKIMHARAAWTSRSRLVAALLALLPDEVDRELVDTCARLAGAGHAASDLVHGALVSRIPERGDARARALDLLAALLVPGNALDALGAVAIVKRDGARAIPTIAAALDSAPPLARVRLTTHLCRSKSDVDFDADPAWVDALFSRVQGMPIAMLEVSYRLNACKTSEPILRALRWTEEEVYWITLLDDLRRIDDPAAAPRLEAMASDLPETPKGSRAKRSRRAVLALAKHLRRKRSSVDAARWSAHGSAGTDGGPLLLVAADAAARWQGVPVDWVPGEDGSDYDRACDVATDGCAMIEVDARRGIVLPEQAASVLRGPDGAVAIVLAGGETDVADTLGQRAGWRATKLRLDVGEGGALLFDAARTTTRFVEGSALDIPIAAGVYAAREHRSAAAHVLLLVPSPATKR